MDNSRSTPNINGNNTRFNSAITPVITVLPVAVPTLDINDSFGVQSTATGVREQHFVRLPATVTGSPVQLNIVSSDPTRVGLSKCFVTPSGALPTDDQNASCNGQPVGASVTVSVPVGQNFAYFDLVGQTTATSDTQVELPDGRGSGRERGNLRGRLQQLRDPEAVGRSVVDIRGKWQQYAVSWERMRWHRGCSRSA